MIVEFSFISAPYVKVYLIDGKNCIEKQKTTVARRTLDPLYQQQLVFNEQYVGKILQVIRNEMVIKNFVRDFSTKNH